MSPDATHFKKFADVYNDVSKYPTIRDVAHQLKLGERTVRRRASEIRSAKGRGVPKLLDRQKPRNRLTAGDHARARAKTLSAEITRLVTRSRYPLVNPGAIIVESHMTVRYTRGGGYTQVESTPRTWLSDTLRVAPIKRANKRRFLFTGAQNDAEIDRPFWNNLQAYAADIGAQIVVGPWTYETQWWSENNPSSRAYAKELGEYLCFGQLKIGENFVFCGEMNTLPTASRPISDLVTYSRGRWAVFPHAKLQLISVASTDPDAQAHQVMTTGAVTRPKVIPRKAGVKSIFHHVIGATLVEFDAQGDLFCRQINAAEDGSFFDLDAFVMNGVVTRGHRAKALVCGDIHVAKLDKTVARATFGLDGTSGSVLDTLRPEMVFLHDLHDNETRNHHHIGDNANSYELAFRKRESVIEEVGKATDFLVKIRRPWAHIMVVESNHDLALERYVREGRYRNDGVNIRIGLQLEDAYLGWRERVATALDADKPVPAFSLLEHAARMLRGTELGHVSWIYDGESFVVHEVECGHHGFRGANGSKGTVSGFARMGRKMSIGDKHTPEILDGVYCAGVCQLHHGYNKGPSGWAVTHIVQYPNGKRSLITLQKGKWRAA